MRACRECGAENPSHARFCLACGSSLAGDGGESRRLVTVLFCDIAGSTALGERHDPEQLRGVLRLFAAEARTVIERHGGTVEKFIGDAVMAVFGIPAVHEDDALRAARAAVELRASITRLSAELEHGIGIVVQTRIGVNSGEALAGDVSRGEGFVTGDVVNVAKRLEERAGADEIWVGRDTYDLVRDAVDAELLPPVAAKGKGKPLTVYRLRGVKAGVLPRARRLDAPLVGRLEEQELLRTLFATVVRDRVCHLVTILGAAGVGKSRLVGALLDEIGAQAEVLRGTCPSYGEGITFWPVNEVVRQAAGITDADRAAVARSKIAAAVPGDEADLVAGRLAHATGLGGTPADAHDIFWALRRLLEARALERPLVVVFDDVHWGEMTFLDLVEHLPDWSRDAPILLLCMGRPDLLETRPGWASATSRATTLSLKPLADDESRLLVENLVGKVDEAVHRRVVETAEGNPLFIEEMIGMLLEEDVETAAVPATIQVLLASRLDRLEPDERLVLGCAAVEGAEFHGGAVAALAGKPVGDALFRLVRKELVRLHRGVFAGEEGFRFRHVLFRDAAYESLPKIRRAELHERYADWFEQAGGEERVPDYEELLGYHREQAFRHRSEIAGLDDTARLLAARAAAHLATGGRRAAARGDMTAAANMFGRAAALLPEVGEQRVEVLVDLGAALAETAELARAGAVLDEAIETAERARLGPLGVRARLEHSYLRLHLDPSYSMEEAARVAREAVQTFERAGDDSGLSRALGQLALVHWARCRLGDMKQVLERALPVAERAGDGRAVSGILEGLCLSSLLGPDRVEVAVRQCEGVAARGASSLRVVATAEQALAMLRAMQGRFDEARELLPTAARTFAELGLTVRRAGVATYAAFVELWADEPAAAEEWLRPAYDELQAIGERSRFSTIAAMLGLALCLQGRLDEAERCVSSSAEAASPDDMASQVISRLARARLLLAGDDPAQALTPAREALDLAEATDFLNLRGDALAGLAEALHATGDLEQALVFLRRAADAYHAKGNEVSATATAVRLRGLDTARRA